MCIVRPLLRAFSRSIIYEFCYPMPKTIENLIDRAFQTKGD